MGNERGFDICKTTFLKNIKRSTLTPLAPGLMLGLLDARRLASTAATPDPPLGSPELIPHHYSGVVRHT